VKAWLVPPILMPVAGSLALAIYLVYRAFS
jgi:hypothetical protein